jgi:hypothetical protein
MGGVIHTARRPLFVSYLPYFWHLWAYLRQFEQKRVKFDLPLSFALHIFSETDRNQKN